MPQLAVPCSLPRGSLHAAAKQRAQRQGGVVTKEQLWEMGFTPSQVRTARRNKLLVPTLGAFAVAEGAPSWAANRSSAFRTALAQAHAARLILGPDTIISGPAAAILQGHEGRARDAGWQLRLAAPRLIVYLPNLTRVKVPGLKPIRGCYTGAIVEWRGLQLADRLTALVDTMDLEYRHEEGNPRELMDLFLQLRWLSGAELEQRLSRREEHNRMSGRSRRVTATLRWMVECAREGTHSEAERALAALLASEGLCRGGPSGWHANHKLAGIDPDGNQWIYRLDFAWPHKRVCVEVDGKAWHSTPEAFERDRERNRRLAAAGWAMIPVTWDAIKGTPQRVATQIMQVLHPPQSLMAQN